MAESKELKKIKKIYGENFMKLCRSLFSTLLEKEGRLYEILSSSFSNNCKNLYEDIIKADCKEKFKSYIYSKVDMESPEKEVIKEKTPYELLKEVGYNLTECLTEEEIQKFKKYYKPREELCTFRGGRLDSHVVFWAVKENAEDIKRKDFDKPQREDEYGTSVMGIQFNRKGMCTVSIKNRYNHTVNNPDATYGNDLDRIAPGLTKSFGTLLKKQYGLELNGLNIESFELPGYVVANDGKYYKYNMEINGDYYCPGNIVIKNREVIHIGKSEEGLLVDYFYIDKRNKTIKACGDIKDSFVDTLQKIENIEVVKSEEENISRIIKIYLQDVEEPALIGIDENNQIVKYVNKNVTNIGERFLSDNNGLTQLEMQNVTKAGDGFLLNNKGLLQLKMPKLIQVGDDFLFCNRGLTQLEMPNLTRVGDHFLCRNKELVQLEMPNLTRVGDHFLSINEGLAQLKMPELKEIGSCFLSDNIGLSQLEMPNLMRVGDQFLSKNNGLTQLKTPNLTRVGDNFLFGNRGLTQLEIPNLIRVGDGFLYGNKGLTQLEMPNLMRVGDHFLCNNYILTQLKTPNLIRVGDCFLASNNGLAQLEMPNLTQTGKNFLMQNEGLTKLKMPKLTETGDNFLYDNKELVQLEMPNLIQIGNNFLYSNNRLTKLEMPKLTETGNDFLYENKELVQLEMPNLTRVGDDFLFCNNGLTKLEMPKLTQVGDFFLFCNAGLAQLEMSNLLKVKEDSSTTIDGNILQKLKNKIITSQNIAQLDKNSKLTTTEVNLAHKIIGKIRTMFKNKDNKKKDEEIR